VFVNLTHGHNGFLTAGLVALALAELDTRPLVAGLCFGLLAYKPQFGVLIPLVLIATGRWRSAAAAAATVALLALAVTAMFGTAIWPAFLAGTHFTRETVLEQGGTGFHKIQSVFAWVRMWGGPVALAYAIQTTVGVAVAVTLTAFWRSSAPTALKGAALCLGTVLTTPYALDYDLMILAPALALFATDGIANGFRPYERTLLTALWFVPIVAREFAAYTHVPLGVPLLLLAFVFAVRAGWSKPAPQATLAPA
jgi:hypothetical protein